MVSDSIEIKIEARRAGFWRNLGSLGWRSIRGLRRDPEFIVPAFFIPVFFYLVNIGIFQDFAENIPGLDYREFQLPVAILFAVTGLSRAGVLVLDIQRGYFDRLALTPVNRFAMIIGFVVADLVAVVLVSIPVLIVGFIFGIGFDTNILGLLLFLLIGVCWAMVYNMISYGIALKTGNPTLVNLSFIMFFPVVFFSTIYLPLEYLTSWLGTIARYNPTTYVLDGMRSLLTPGWDGAAIGYAFLGIAVVGVLTMSFALWGLRARLRRK